jgi:CheY-like chemotaxis protein
MSSGSLHSILLADDDSDARALLRTLLRTEAETIDEAADGEEAIAKLDSVQYDAVVLDIMLPRSNGFEVFEKIRTLPVRPRVVVFSALSRHFGDRFDDDVIVLQKPFSTDAVVAAVCGRP